MNDSNYGPVQMPIGSPPFYTSPIRRTPIRIDPPEARELPEGIDGSGSGSLPIFDGADDSSSDPYYPTPTRVPTMPTIPTRVPGTAPPPTRVPGIPTIPTRMPDTTWIPSRSDTDMIHPTTLPMPSPMKEVFTHNGTKYQCEWVYCCHPISNNVPEKLEPSIFEDSRDIILWTDDQFPEYKIDKCNNAIGFCLRTRNSTFRLIFRIIYPNNIPEEAKREIYQCAEEGAAAAVVAITAQIAAMRAAPPSIPALLPNLLEIAYVSGKTAFINCIRNKAAFDYIEGKVRYSVYHEQTSNEGWKTFSDADALDLIKKFYLYSSGLILIPGIGNFKDLSDKIGIDMEGIDNFVKNPGKTIEDWKDKATKELSKPLDRIFKW